MLDQEEKNVRVIRKSKLFDADWYRREYPEVVEMRLDPAVHYLRVGARKGYNPSAEFGTQAYLRLNPDVGEARLNPLLHYEMHGRSEGRLYSDSQLKEPVFPAEAVPCERHFAIGPKKTGRLAVFAAYFPSGTVPEADLYYLRGLREVVDNIVLVADSPVFPDEVKKLEGLVTVVACQRHGEYDFGSYKRGYQLAEAAGLLNPERTSELVLANDSCIGPVYSFGEVFAGMEAINCDFWGMTQYSVRGHVHIQSFFCVFRSEILSAGTVGEFFAQYEGSSSRIDVILRGELRLTEYLVERGGFAFSSYLPAGVFSELPMKYPLTALQRYRLPLLKVKTLKGDSRESLKTLSELLLRENPEVARIVSGLPVDPNRFVRETTSVRGIVKQFIPYGLERRYQVKHYGMDETTPVESVAGALGWLKRGIAQILPYGFVIWRNRRDGGVFHADSPSLKRRLLRRGVKDPFVSVVVASYNYEKLVLETLESLWEQTYRNFEIVVVDDGSADSSREAIREFMGRHAGGDVGIRLLTHPDNANRGLAATVELGVRESRGSYVAFCEADDLWTRDHLEAVMAEMRRFAYPPVVVNDVAIFGDPVGVARAERNRALRYKLLCHTLNRISPTRFRRMNYILTFSCVMVRRELLMKCDYRPEAHPPALDWWLWRQVCFANDIFFVNRKLTRWRMHDSYLEKTRVVRIGEKPIAQREKELMEACDRVIAGQHPLSFVRRWLMVPPKTPQGPSYQLQGARRRAFYQHRKSGLKMYRDQLARNRKARVLVCLHLFYEDAWPLISEYLGNLDAYDYDLIVTCIKGALSERTREAVGRRVPHVRIVETENCGFDIGPFVEALNGVSLSDYDIVFKLQSKGIRRKFICIYNQVFKWSDWFFNLYDGILDGLSVHVAIDALMEGRAKMVAAENLVVADPKHKQWFVERWCREKGLPYVEDYRFVAGTCFAVRAEALRPLQDLRLRADAFGETTRGVFSLAHFLERWMCFSANGAILGIPVSRNVYPREVAAMARTSALRLLEDARFRLDYEFFYRVMEMRRVRKYEVVEVRLGDIRRRWFNGQVRTLDECEPFKYLNGDRKAYEVYCAENREISGFAMNAERFDRLVEDMREYDPLMMPVVKGEQNLIFDGQHRCCILLRKFGPEHVIKVLRFEE